MGFYGEVRVLSIYLLVFCSLVWGPTCSSCVPAFDFVFVDWPDWKVVKAGNDVELTCATNLPPDSIQWYHNHRPIPRKNLHYAIEKLGKNGSSLCIAVSKEKKIYQRLEGLYQCVASVGAVSVMSLPGRLQVAFMGHFPSALVNHRSLRIAKNAIIIVPCRKPDSLPELEIVFYKDGDILNTNQFNRYFTTDVGDLVILSADESIEGTYSCAAFNSLLNKTVNKNSSTEVRIESSQKEESFSLPFNFIYKNQTRVIKGDEIMLLCVQHGHKNPTYEWRRKYVSTSMMEVILEQNSPLLKITAYENCIYACYVKSVTGSTSSNISVTVQDPPYIKMAPQNISVNEGENIRLECSFGGNPLPTISWVFNGRFLGGRNFISFDHEISLKNVSRKQTGVYQCFAFNPSGAAYGTSLVQVIPKTIFFPKYNELISASKENRKKHKRKRIKDKIGKKKKRKHIKDIATAIPSKPNVTKLTDESVLIAWNLIDEFKSNNEILFFKVQFKTASGHTDQKNKWRTVSETIVPPATTCEVTGLLVNNYYRFRVAAVYSNNDHTFGPSSNKFFLEKFSRLQHPPNPPQILAVESYENNSIMIAWSYESQVYTEGFIIHYRRTGILEDYTKVVLLGDERRRFTVHQLKNDTPYDFKVSSFNMAGMSDYSGRKTFLPSNFRGYSSEDVRSSTAIPVVLSDREMVSTTHLGFGIGIGLLVLLIIVASSFVLHSCNKRRKILSEEGVGKEKRVYLDQESQYSPCISRARTSDVECSETLKLEDH